MVTTWWPFECSYEAEATTKLYKLVWMSAQIMCKWSQSTENNCLQWWWEKETAATYSPQMTKIPPLWMYCVQYTLIFLFKRCNLTKGRNIFKHEKHIQHLFRVSRNIGPWHNQHFGPSLTSEGKLSQFVRCFISNYLCHTRQTMIMMRTDYVNCMYVWFLCFKFCNLCPMQNQNYKKNQGV